MKSNIRFNPKLYNPRLQIIILLLSAFVLYFNTLFNQYAMDDAVVYTDNTLVQKGISAIPQLLQTDMYYGMGKHDVNLAGGRYRPLSLITYAIEYQFFGLNPFVSHLVNILLFLFLVYFLYQLLFKYLFQSAHPLLAFFTCLFFVFHPIHTEVIANIKSRDEIITMLLMVLSSLSFIRFCQNKKWFSFLLSMAYFFLACITKEAALPMVGLVPLAAYFVCKQNLIQSLRISIPYWVLAIIYFLLRTHVVGWSHLSGTEIMNFPYAYATPSQAFATKVWVLIFNGWLLLYPLNLACDYGYNQIPYVDIISWQFICSALLLLGLVAIVLNGLKQRRLFAFAILLMVFTFALCSNFLFEVGAFLGERFLFQPSLGFSIILAIIFIQLSQRYLYPTILISSLVLLSFGCKTILRNQDWKNDETLYFHDVKIVTQSVRANYNVGSQYLTLALAAKDPAQRLNFYHQAEHYDTIALNLYRHYAPIYIDLGMVQLGLNKHLLAAKYWLMATQLDPLNPLTTKRNSFLSDVLYNKANHCIQTAELDSAIAYLNLSTQLNPLNSDAFYNLGQCFFKENRTQEGLLAWQKVQNLDPNRLSIRNSPAK